MRGGGFRPRGGGGRGDGHGMSRGGGGGGRGSMCSNKFIHLCIVTTNLCLCLIVFSGNGFGPPHHSRPPFGNGGGGGGGDQASSCQVTIPNEVKCQYEKTINRIDERFQQYTKFVSLMCSTLEL
jgi:hypothetical protein